MLEYREPARLVRQEFVLQPGQALALEARPARSDAVPVLHLWDLEASTEVALERGSRFFGSAARLAYKNPHARARRYALLVHAADPERGGAIDLLRDRRPLQTGARIAGAPRAVAGGKDYAYRVVATPGGPRAAVLYAFDEDGRLLAIAEDGGPLGLPLLSGRADVRALALVADRGGAVVYANDAQDRDGDGLGRRLERALGTCDTPDDQGCAQGPLAAYYRSSPDATRDSDRDGLSDADELFGAGSADDRESAALLDLPRFGADPRHKDVFVEVDREARVEAPGLSGKDIADIAALFAPGSARELKNPDGLAGVRLHLDIGAALPECAARGLCGDFGGSGVAAHADYKQARTSDFSPARRGYFRYALLTRTGTGQASGSAFTVNRDYNRVAVFAHELAHTLGLGHHGHNDWGRENCKPNYYSIMNYVFQNRADVGFARRALPVLDPSRVVESAGLGPMPAAELTRSPFELDLIDGAPDWNRDGVITDEPVRAALTYATFKSCGASGKGRTTLFEGAVAAQSPVLLKLGERLVALWLDPEGALQVSEGRVSGPDAYGSCPELARDPERCMAWSEPARVNGAPALRLLDAAALDGTRMAIAAVDPSGQLQLLIAERGAEGLAVRSQLPLPGARTRLAPAIAWLPVAESRYGAARALAILYVANGGDGAAAGPLMQASAADERGPFLTRAVLDTRAQGITSAEGPTLVELGGGERCAVFPDRERSIRFYCYEPAQDAWLDLSQRAFYLGTGPRTSSKVGLAFHRYRTAEGAPVGGDPSRGALYLSFTEPFNRDKPDSEELPYLLVSEWLDASAGPRARIDFRWRFAIIDQWTYVIPGTGVTLYEDESLSALKAALAVEIKDKTRVDFLPLADGTFPAQLQSGNDFEVMERGICRGIRPKDQCGQDD